MKKCTVCKIIKHYSEFYKSKNSDDSYGYRCKECDGKTRKKSRNRSTKNKTKIGARNRSLIYNHNLTLEQYEEMLIKQDYKCAICKTENPRGIGVINPKPISFCVDHNHTTRKIRGLLCNLCNRGLGFFQDRYFIVETAFKYLLNHEENSIKKDLEINYAVQK